jgi:hypothetical protein
MLPRCALVIAAAAGCSLLAACSSDNPPNPYPSGATPTAMQLAPQSMVLRPNQMAGYKRTEDSSVDAGILADQAGDPSLVATIKGQGLQQGARVSFSDPNAGAAPTPFATVISQALIFRDVAGATAFFHDETARRSQPPQGGTLTPLDNLPLGGADQIVGLTATLPAQSTGQPPGRALFALIRRGPVVAELLGGGAAATATDAGFTALVGLQEQQLAAQPQ